MNATESRDYHNKHFKILAPFTGTTPWPDNQMAVDFKANSKISVM